MPDTIFAPATVRGRSAIAVIRISGPQALLAAERLAGSLPTDRRAGVRWLRDPDTGERLDQALVLVLPKPGSFTGEDCVEFQTHGSAAVVSGVLAALGKLDGVRLAEPGEFTRRALLNDRLDLAQVEGLSDLLAAETAAQRRQALDLVDGVLSGLVSGWRGELLESLALLEAMIDFADEELPEDLLERVSLQVERVRAAMLGEIASATVGERIRDGFEVALVGLPNVGKSTLLNYLARREVALVSPEEGTTRDVLEVRLDLTGLPVTVLDMAGLRHASGVEAAGVARARQRAESADIRVFLVECDRDVEVLGVRRRPDDVVALAKGDLRSGVGISGATGQGVDDLIARLSATLCDRVGSGSTIVRQRQRQAVAEALRALELAMARLEDGAIELAAEEVRLGMRSLDFLVGRVDVEAVLDVIFSSFCLGK